MLRGGCGADVDVSRLEDRGLVFRTVKKTEEGRRSPSERQHGGLKRREEGSRGRGALVEFASVDITVSCTSEVNDAVGDEPSEKRKYA